MDPTRSAAVRGNSPRPVSLLRFAVRRTAGQVSASVAAYFKSTASMRR
jgi:hypothetical protein